MKTNQSFSLLFWARTSKDSALNASIYARITVNGKRIEFSLSKNILKSEWDSKKGRVKGSKENSRVINNYLEHVKGQINMAYNELLQEGKLITSASIKARYFGEDTKYYTIKELFEYHNTVSEHKLNKYTMKHYKTTQKYIKLFLAKKYKKNDDYLRNLNYAFIVDFEHFLKAYTPNDHQRKISNNTAMKHLQRLRKMVTMAFHNEWIDRDPFVKFKSSFEKREREYLTEEELKRLVEFNSSINRLNIVKDLFVFSCYTGVSYIDIMQLTSDNIMKGIDGEDWIVTKRQKTNTSIKVPLFDIPKYLIDKYRDHQRTAFSNTLFPVVSNQKVNSYLKEIADICSIKKNLTFHMARHTFATTITLSNGVPIETVSKLLGHTKIATTQIYARILDKKVSEDMRELKTRIS